MSCSSRIIRDSEYTIKELKALGLTGDDIQAYDIDIKGKKKNSTKANTDIRGKKKNSTTANTQQNRCSRCGEPGHNRRNTEQCPKGNTDDFIRDKSIKKQACSYCKELGHNRRKCQRLVKEKKGK